jgi:hypothetical protein
MSKQFCGILTILGHNILIRKVHYDDKLKQMSHNIFVCTRCCTTFIPILLDLDLGTNLVM